MIKLRRSHLPTAPASREDTVTVDDGDVSISDPIDLEGADLVLPETFRDATMSLDSWAR